MKRNARLPQRWSWDPCVPVDWRARDAESLSRGEVTNWADDDDPFVAAYAEFLKGNVMPAAVPTWSAICVAHEISQQNGVGQWELKARVLARQTDVEIADRLGLAADVVAWYERLFFAVRHCLNAWAYIDNVVISAGLWAAFQEDELDRLWMAVGYHGGLEALNAFVDAFHEVWQPDMPATIAVYFDEASRASLDMQAVVATHAVPVSKKTEREFMQIHLRLQKALATGHMAGAAVEKLKDKTINLYLAALGRAKVLTPNESLAVDETATGQGQAQPSDSPHTAAGYPPS